MAKESELSQAAEPGWQRHLSWKGSGAGTLSSCRCPTDQQHQWHHRCACLELGWESAQSTTLGQLPFPLGGSLCHPLLPQGHWDMSTPSASRDTNPVRMEGQAADGSHSLSHEPIVVLDVVDQLPVPVVDRSELVHGATGREGTEHGVTGNAGRGQHCCCSPWLSCVPDQSAATSLSGRPLTGGQNHSDPRSPGTGKHGELMPKHTQGIPNGLQAMGL